MKNLPIGLLQGFSQKIEDDGGSLQLELEGIREFRRATDALPDVSIQDTIEPLDFILSILPPQHAKILAGLSTHMPITGKKGMKGLKEIIDGLADGAEEFIQYTITALDRGRVTDRQGSAADLDRSLLEESMIQYVILKRLAERRQRLIDWSQGK